MSPYSEPRELALTRPLPYLAFVQEISNRGTLGAFVTELEAGLVAIRAVHAWFAGGARNDWGLDGAGRMIEGIDDNSALKRPLATLLAAMAQSVDASSRKGVRRALWLFGRHLEFEGLFLPAAAVYETIIRDTSASKQTLHVRCWIRIGLCCRWSNDLQRGRRACKAAAELARTIGDRPGLQRARLGLVQIAVGRGNLPVADRLSSRVLRWAQRSGHRVLTAKSLHARVSVAFLREDYESSVELAYRALQHTTNTIERERILCDVSAAFLWLGLHVEARDSLSALAATSRQQTIRWCAMLYLLEAESFLGNGSEARRYEALLTNARLSAEQRTFFLVTLGQAYDRLGDVDTARRHLRHGFALAVEHGVNWCIIAAEKSLSLLGTDQRFESRPSATAARIAAQLQATARVRT